MLNLFFRKQNKKIIRNIWIVLGILVIVSMLLLYGPGYSFFF